MIRGGLLIIVQDKKTYSTMVYLFNSDFRK